MQDEPEQVKPFTVRHCMLLVQLELYDNLETSQNKSIVMIKDFLK